MNQRIGKAAKTVRTLLEDDEINLCDRDRELLEDCYLTLERIAIKRPLTASSMGRERHAIVPIDTNINGVEIEYEGAIK